MERLVHERAVALGNAMDKSTLSSYGSALNSYLSFTKNHNLPVDPSPDTLSFFAVYMCHHINPRSVNTYLSGIVQQLEPYFPNVRTARNSNIVRRTLQGCMRMRGVATSRKRALTIQDLKMVAGHFSSSSCHDDLLFVAMLFTGFFGLLRLGEMTFPDDRRLRNWKKVVLRKSVDFSVDCYEFHLPGHKADRFFAGSQLILGGVVHPLAPLPYFRHYLERRDALFPAKPALWLRESGASPSRSWFRSLLRLYFPGNLSGHSMRRGGASALAEHGVPLEEIRLLGHWSSEAFEAYVRWHALGVCGGASQWL